MILIEARTIDMLEPLPAGNVMNNWKEIVIVRRRGIYRKNRKCDSKREYKDRREVCSSAGLTACMPLTRFHETRTF